MDSLALFVESMHAIWPEHDGFVARALGERTPEELADTRFLADVVLKLVDGQPADSCASYRWMSEIMVEEELFFRRNDRYRFSSFAEVEKVVYSDASYMRRYLEGLLLSQLFWSNHARAISRFQRHFLPGLRPGFRLLEVGPGHGLFLYLSAATQRASRVEGWDVSPQSLAQTERALNKLGMQGNFVLRLGDVLHREEREPFDAIVMSEILEHLERPADFLRKVRGNLAPEGKLFINVPLNSPAPDHIYLLRSAQEARSLVEGCGYHVEDLAEFPMTGWSLEKARKRNASISCVIVASGVSA